MRCGSSLPRAQPSAGIGGEQEATTFGKCWDGGGTREPRLPAGRRGFSVQMSSEVRKGGEGSLSRGHSSSDTQRGAWHGLYRTSVSMSLTGSKTLTIPEVSPPPVPLPSCGRGGNSVILPFLGAELKVQTALPFLPVDSWRYSELRTPG